MSRLFLPVKPRPAVLLIILFLAASLGAETQSAPVLTGAGQTRESAFPSVYFMDYVRAYNAQNAGRPYGTAPREPGRPAGNPSMLLNNDILAFYGHPLSPQMGILGRYSKEELDALLTELAEQYRPVNGNRGIRKAFYIIYGTVWPRGEIGIINEAVLLDYIQYALERDILVFIDHQIGRYDPIDALKSILPYLRYPNVHLALDPEWRTAKPMVEIGAISAGEINLAQQIMEDYILEHRLPGERMLVIHQFNWRMISDREEVRSGFERVRLIHCADGFGTPYLKRKSYAYNALAKNIPIKAFKLFYNFGIPGAGYDDPLLTPEEVLALKPRPYLIMYQ
jgi:hypothetical protein